jgi:DNA polymerase III delta prime subunit
MEEVVSQNHIVEYLLSCKTNYSHLLFTGSTGIGKTFLAQEFLRYALREIPEADIPRYILKLSSSDDRGIASLRQRLLEFLRSNRKYDITAWVWIDDADSLPVLTQQALRRLMERYESHVRFLFSSCSSQSFIEPIQSRTVILQLLPINLYEHMEHFQKKYAPNVRLTEEAKNWIVGFCLGNARQFCLLLRLLESVSSSSSSKSLDNDPHIVDLQEIQNYITPPPVAIIRELCLGILKNNLIQIFQNLHDLLTIGYTVEDILHYIQVVTQVYSFFLPLDLIKLNERCSEVHIRLIQRRFGFFETLKVFAGEIQKDDLFPFRITTGCCDRMDNCFRL